MDNTRLELASAEDIEHELGRIASPDFRGIATGRECRAAQLFTELHRRFKANAGNQRILGHPHFTSWAESFCDARGLTRRTVWRYVKAGRFLLPRISEAEFEGLNVKKREILAALAEAGRLTPEFLSDSFTISDDELRRKADPLLGKIAPWEERLDIREHKAAIAALLQLGNLLEYKTYTAHPGEQFEGMRLGSLATLGDFPRLPTEEIERSAKRIDVIWVNMESWPESFFEVENTTDVTHGLHRMYQVLKIKANFFIVAPEKVRERFGRAVSQSPYKQHRRSYVFRSYHELHEIFQAALRYRKARDAFFEQPEN